MRNELKRPVWWLMLVWLFGLGIYCGTAFPQTEDTRSNKIKFELKKTAILESERRNVIDKRVYEAMDGQIVEFEAEFFRLNPREIKPVFNQIRSEWDECSDFEDVIDVGGEIVGTRMICKREKESRTAIIFSYETILTSISGISLDVIKEFESQTCVRSRLVEGVPCQF